MTIKAIETRYNGYRFRSRLEARWAVFFDALGIEYDYEPEGFDLGDAGWYLPDFWLPKQECWIEVKGQWPNQQEMEKAKALGKCLGQDVYVFPGSIGVPTTIYETYDPATDSWHKRGSIGMRIHWTVYPEHGSSSLLHTWADCPVCRSLEIVEWPMNTSMKCGCLDRLENYLLELTEPAWEGAAFAPLDIRKLIFNLEVWNQTHKSAALIAAYEAARSARFEHGESGG